jgi:predicted HTH transcriptional regulator
MAEELRISLTEEELLSRMVNTEDNFVERKRFSDDREWARTAVAFANSCPVGFPGILFIGVYDGGTVERPKIPVNLDRLQKTLGERLADVWPPLYYVSKILRRDGFEFLAVLVPGSLDRPHFAGHSYVRLGSETKKASEEQFARLIFQRTSKAREIEKMIGKSITWEMFGGRQGNAQATLLDCNQFFITVDGGTYKRCFPLDWITISFDPANNRYHLVVQHP